MPAKNLGTVEISVYTVVCRNEWRCATLQGCVSCVSGALLGRGDDWVSVTKATERGSLLGHFSAAEARDHSRG